MIIKRNDARPDVIQALERQAETANDTVKRAACRGAISRLRANQHSNFAADLIDVQFAQCDDWAVLHDLNLRINGHAIHLNHLLINRHLEFFCLDTRYIQYGFDLGANGECHVFDRLERKPIASPLNKAAKDARKLAELLQTHACIPGFMGFERRFKVRALLVTNPALRLGLLGNIDNPAIGAMTSSGLFTALWKTTNASAALSTRRISVSALQKVAIAVADLHRPVYSKALLSNESLVTDQTRVLLRQIA